MAMAQDEARALGEPEVGPEHLLLGLFREGVAIRVHEGVGDREPVVEDRAIRPGVETLRARLGAPRPRPRTLPPGRLPFTAAASLTLEIALERALEMGHRRVEPEHVLLALLEDPSQLTAAVLGELHVDAVSLRTATMARYPTRARQRSQPPR
jgi:ATP-dependent Clp protease ATP-binding subunit ClpA